MKRGKMLAVVSLFTMLPALVQATPDRFACRFDPPVGTMRFLLDPSQFAAPISPLEPPRRQTAEIRLKGQPLLGEAILAAGGAKGFWLPSKDIMLILHADGAATLTVGPDRHTGSCKEER